MNPPYMRRVIPTQYAAVDQRPMYVNRAPVAPNQFAQAAQPIQHALSPLKKTESRAAKQVGTDFLPSIVNEAYHNVLEQFVTAMCYSANFDDIEEGALETLILIFHTYVKKAGEQARLACEVAGRTIINPGDVWFGLINMGMDVEKLPDFLNDIVSQNLTIHAPEISPPDAKSQPLHIGKPKPHPPYVFDWMPPLPDPHTYIRTEITNEPDMSYEKVREAMSQKKRNGVTSLVNYMVRTYPSYCLFSNFEKIIHEQVEKSIDKESKDRRLEEAFVAFRDLLETTDIEVSAANSRTLFEKGLISQYELDSGIELACLCSDGTIIDANGQILRLADSSMIDLEERDRVGSSKSRVHALEAGAESLRFHWNMDEMLDEIIEVDSCAMDLQAGRKAHDEMKFLQDKFTFEYIPEWCHVLEPTADTRLYLQQTLNELKMEEETKSDAKVVTNEEETEEDSTPDNPYFRPPSIEN